MFYTPFKKGPDRFERQQNRLTKIIEITADVVIDENCEIVIVEQACTRFA